MTDLLKLNIGAGDSKIPGFISHDIKDGNDAQDLSKYADGSVDEIYASHVLEHIHHSDTDAALAEWERVLRPGGRIRIAIPDFDLIRTDYDSGKMDDNMYNAYMYGAYSHDRDWHQSHFGRARIVQWLQYLGMDDIKNFESEYLDATRTCPYTLNIEATKRQFSQPKNPTVTVVLSTPRFGPIDFNHCAAKACRDLGWNFMYHGGTEWGAGLTKAIKTAIEEFNPDYIMNLDYDSTFTTEDCQELLRLLEATPDAAVVFPVQTHRHCNKPLAYHSSYGYEGDVTRVKTGHFGCTIIRAEVLKALPEPWFLSLPDPDTGRWDGNKIDADIYFWQQMMHFGFKTYQANNVVIGHMELCVMWPCGDGTLYQPIVHWRDNGKPPNVMFDPAAMAKAEAAGRTEKKRCWRDADDKLGVRGPKPEHENGVAEPAAPEDSATWHDRNKAMTEAPDGSRTG